MFYGPFGELDRFILINHDMIVNFLAPKIYHCFAELIDLFFYDCVERELFLCFCLLFCPVAFIVLLTVRTVLRVSYIWLRNKRDSTVSEVMAEFTNCMSQIDRLLVTRPGVRFTQSIKVEN